jgi:RNA polymerase sigma factor (sigma-70 family)
MRGMSPEQEHELTLLMAAGQQGDRAAYEALMCELQVVVSLYVRRRVGTASWAEDVTQDVLLSIHRSRHTWNPVRPFAPWFYAVMQSRLVDAIRRQRRTARWEGPMDPADRDVRSESPEATAIARADLAEAMQRLSPVQRLVIERLKLRERSVKHVAAETGLSESNVKVIAHRGYAALKRLLSGARYDR